MTRKEFIAELLLRECVSFPNFEPSAEWFEELKTFAGRAADHAQDVGAFDTAKEWDGTVRSKETLEVGVPAPAWDPVLVRRHFALLEAIDRMKELADGSNLAWPAGFSAVLDARSMFP